VAEGARLESVFRGNSNVGSNPTLSARQWVAEKSDGLALKIARNGRDSATLLSEPDWRKCRSPNSTPALQPFSPDDTLAFLIPKLLSREVENKAMMGPSDLTIVSPSASSFGASRRSFQEKMFKFATLRSSMGSDWLFRAEIALAPARGSQHQSLVQLSRALGRGWL
jgi:hypothetical protein